MKIQYLIILLLSVYSCDKSDTTVQICVFPPCELDTVMQKIDGLCWAVAHHRDTSLCGSLFPIVGMNAVIFSDFLCQSPPRDIISGYDKISGEKLWDWEDPGFNPSRSLISGYHEGVIVIKDWSRMWGIDENTGETLWHKDIEEKGAKSPPRMSVYDEYMYYTVGQGYDHLSSACLVKASVFSGEIIDTLFCRDSMSTGGFTSNFQSITIWNNPQNEEILFAQNRMIGYNVAQDRSDIIAFNMTTDELLWESKNVIGDESGSIRKMTVDVNKVYFQGNFTILCLNTHNGKKVWSVDVRDIDGIIGAAAARVKIIDNMLILASNYFLVFDKTYGNLIYKTKGEYYSNSPDQTIVFENKILYPNEAGLACFDPYQRKNIWAYDQPYIDINRISYYAWGINIDADSRMMYGSDGFYGTAWKIPD